MAVVRVRVLRPPRPLLLPLLPGSQLRREHQLMGLGIAMARVGAVVGRVGRLLFRTDRLRLRLLPREALPVPERRRGVLVRRVDDAIVRWRSIGGVWVRGLDISTRILGRWLRILSSRWGYFFPLSCRWSPCFVCWGRCVVWAFVKPFHSFFTRFSLVAFLLAVFCPFGCRCRLSFCFFFSCHVVYTYNQPIG